MTAIAGIIDKKNNITYLASDEMGSNGFTGENFKTPKLFRNGVLSVAFCGSYRLGQILKYNLKPRNFEVGETIDEYVFNYLEKEIRNILKERKFLQEDLGVQSIGGSEIIFAVKDRLFVMQSDLAILEPEHIFVTSGSGKFHLEASIYTQLKLAKNKSYKAILADAINYTSNIVLSVGGKPQIISHKHF